MAVEVTKYRDAFRIILSLSHWHLQEVQLRMQCWVRVAPPSVKVNSCQRRSGISKDHSIRINHRHQLNDVVFQNLVVLYVILGQLLDQWAHDERAMGLSCVQSRLNVNHLLFLVRDGPSHPALGHSDLEHVQAAHRLRYHLLAPLKVVVRDLKVLLVWEGVSCGLVQDMLFKLVSSYLFPLYEVAFELRCLKVHEFSSLLLNLVMHEVDLSVCFRTTLVRFVNEPERIFLRIQSPIIHLLLPVILAVGGCKPFRKRCVFRFSSVLRGFNFLAGLVLFVIIKVG